MRFLVFLAAILVCPFIAFFAALSVKSGPSCGIRLIATYLMWGLLSAIALTSPVVRWKGGWDAAKASLGWLAFLGFTGLLQLPKFFSTICR